VSHINLHPFPFLRIGKIMNFTMPVCSIVFYYFTPETIFMSNTT